MIVTDTTFCKKHLWPFELNRQKIGLTNIIHTFLLKGHDETEVATNLFFRIVTYIRVKWIIEKKSSYQKIKLWYFD